MEMVVVVVEAAAVVVVVVAAAAELTVDTEEGGRGNGKRGRRSEGSGKGSRRLSCRRSRTKAM